MAQQSEHEKKIEEIVKIMAALYDKAAAYTNLIIIAGYAAFFAVWGNIKGQLGKREMLYAALLMKYFFDLFHPMGNNKNVHNSYDAENVAKCCNRIATGTF